MQEAKSKMLAEKVPIPKCFDTSLPVTDIIGKLYKEIEKIKVSSEKIYIANAGIMNHGKSSLFNSLLNKEVFKTGDIRITVEESEAQFYENVYFLDTPGLAANEGDDEIALEAYKKADMVIFVHTLNVGELHKKGIYGIKAIENQFSDKEYFWKHFCIVLTSVDRVNDTELKSIKNKIANDLRKECKQENIKIFEISNTRYVNGVKQGNQIFVEKSGIPQLKDYLMREINNLRQEAKRNRENEIDNLCMKAQCVLEQKKRDVEAKLASRKQELDKKRERLAADINDAYNSTFNLEMEIMNTSSSVSLSEALLSCKRVKHDVERSKYKD